MMVVGGIKNFLKSTLSLISLGSLGLTSLVLYNAYYQRGQFYPSVVYITKSNPSMAIIYIQAFVCIFLMGKLLGKIFFGRLRAAELEHLIERSWYAVTETCLAFTVFKDDFSPKFVGLFTLLLFLKSFHWLSEDRVDYMERSPAINLLFHIRLIGITLLLGLIDAHFLLYAYNSTLTKGASVQLVFGFEYAVLLTIILNAALKYILHSIDLYSTTQWENKAVFMLYTELAIGLIKVLLYIFFIVIMVRIYTLPLFAVRPMYLTMRSFKKAFNDVILSRRAIHNMNTWYPDATPEELANTDNVCIICREEMNAPSTKKLPCNHIFHKNCLRSWFQRQQTCPTCRLDVLRAVPGGANQHQRARQQQRPQNQQQPQPQQPQQQQQQQQQPPNLQINPENLFAHIFPRMQIPPPHAAPPPPPPTASSASSTSTTTNTNATMVPPMMMAPPPFPFFPPFNIPPPMPPTNFNGLSDEELSAMEGRERENVEARIKCLKNIQVLLDAAVMEMQQYSQVVSRINQTNPTMTTTSTSSSTTTEGAAASSSSTKAEDVKSPTPDTGAISKGSSNSTSASASSSSPKSTHEK